MEAARLDSVRPPNLTHEKHLERLASLESGKFALAKQIRDAEIAIEYLLRLVYIGLSSCSYSRLNRSYTI